MNETFFTSCSVAYAEKQVENEHADTQKCSFRRSQVIIFQIASLLFPPSRCTRSESLPQTDVSLIDLCSPYVRREQINKNGLRSRQNYDGTNAAFGGKWVVYVRNSNNSDIFRLESHLNSITIHYLSCVSVSVFGLLRNQFSSPVCKGSWERVSWCILYIRRPAAASQTEGHKG